MPSANDPSGDCNAIVLDSINDGVFTVDNQWHITSFNKAAEQDNGRQSPTGDWKTLLRSFSGEYMRNGLCFATNLGYPVVPSSIKLVYILDARGNRLPISISTAVFQG